MPGSAAQWLFPWVALSQSGSPAFGNRMKTAELRSNVGLLLLSCNPLMLKAQTCKSLQDLVDELLFFFFFPPDCGEIWGLNSVLA